MMYFHPNPRALRLHRCPTHRQSATVLLVRRSGPRQRHSAPPEWFALKSGRAATEAYPFLGFRRLRSISARPAFFFGLSALYRNINVQNPGKPFTFLQTDTRKK